MASALPRPRQVTVAGWMIMAGSAAVVLTVFQQIAGLHSIDTRDAVERVLGEPPLDTLDVSVDQVLDVIRVLSMVAAACATATAILGWQALQRSKSARIALSVLAVPLFLTGIGTGGILSTVVAVAVLLLWVQPARDWFDGEWKPAPPESPARPDARAAAAQRTPTTRAGSPGSPGSPGSQPGPHPSPPPYAGWPPPPGAWPPPPGAAPAPPQADAPAPWPPAAAGWPPPQATSAPANPTRPPAPANATRPPAVLAAVVLTWVCSALLGGLFVIGAVWLIASPDTLMDEMTRQNPELVEDGSITVGLLRGVLGVLTGLVVVWVLAACVVAFFVLRGAPWARIVLLVSSVVAALALVLCSLVNAAMVVPLAAAAAVVALLVRRDVVAWFRRPR